MKKRTLFILLCALLLSAAGCSSKTETDLSQTSDSTAPVSETDSEQPQDTAENTDETENTIEFEAVTIDGEAVSSDVFSESRLTMVNVWATYCNPCLNEMPGLGELTAEYDSADFQIIGVISDVTEFGQADTLALAESLIKDTGADYPHLLLNEALYYALLSDVTAVPTTFFFSEDGELLDTVVGAMSKTAWEEKIDELLETL